MRLVLVRHALPERIDGAAGTAGGAAGAADPALTDIGGRQAERLVAALADPVPDAVYTSPMRRAVQTAAPLAAALGLEPVVVDDLIEFDSEAGHYIPIGELAATSPDVFARMRSGHLPAHVDVAAFTERVAAAMEAIVHGHPGRACAVVVAHAGVINVWLARLLGSDRSLPFPLDYAGITRIVASRDGMRRVRTVNEIAHVVDLLE